MCTDDGIYDPPRDCRAVRGQHSYYSTRRVQFTDAMQFIATEQPSANPEWLAAFKESAWRNRLYRHTDLLAYPLTGYLHTLAYAHFILQYKEEVHRAWRHLNRFQSDPQRLHHLGM